ncbi:uncharacterized protein V6R79_024265 [Siganus canaliculatus]
MQAFSFRFKADMAVLWEELDRNLLDLWYCWTEDDEDLSVKSQEPVTHYLQKPRRLMEIPRLIQIQLNMENKNDIKRIV